MGEAEVPLERQHEEVHHAPENGGASWISWVALSTVAVLFCAGAWLFSRNSSPRDATRVTRDAQSQHEQSHAPSSPGQAEPTGQLRVDHFGDVSMREMSDLLASKNLTEIGLIAHDLERLPAGSQTTSAVTQFFKAWAEIDPNSALQTALKFSDVGLKETALNALVENVTPSAAGQLARALADAPQGSLSPGFRSDLLGRAIAKWSVAEPAAAAQFLDQHPEARVGMQGIPMAANGVAMNWARIDPEAAIDWASKQPNPNGVMQGVMAGWWEKDPEAAAAYAQQHLATFEEQKLAGIVANRMAARVVYI